MSNKNLDAKHYVIGKRIIRVSGSFVPLTGAGTIVASSVTGWGFGYAPVAGVMALRAQPQNNPTPLTTPGIVRNSAGLYTITTEDPYLEVKWFDCNLAGPAAGTALWAQPVEPVANTGVANKGVAVQVLITNNAGTPTDANANMRLYFAIEFRDSTVLYQKP